MLKNPIIRFIRPGGRDFSGSSIGIVYKVKPDNCGRKTLIKSTALNEEKREKKLDKLAYPLFRWDRSFF